LSSAAFNRLHRGIKGLCEAFETINYHVFNQLHGVTAFDPILRSRTYRNGENRLAKYWRSYFITTFITTEMVPIRLAARSQQLEAVSLAECRVLTAECCFESIATHGNSTVTNQTSTVTNDNSIGINSHSIGINEGSIAQKALRQPLTPMFSMNVLMHWAKKSICNLFALLAKGRGRYQPSPTRFQSWQMTIQSWQIRFQSWQIVIQWWQMTLQSGQKSPNPNVFNECVDQWS